MATFGRQVEDFLNGPIGSLIVAKARSQIQAAIEKLKKTDPEDAKAIRAHQNEVMVAESITSWLGEAVHEGQVALEALKEDQDGR